MDVLARAQLLASHEPTTRGQALAAHASSPDPALAAALKTLYVEAITGNPALAAGAAATLAQMAAATPDDETSAMNDWVAGMAAIQIEGRIEAAIPLIDRAAAKFEAIGQLATAAATQPTKLYALALLGRYDEAIACGERARSILLDHGDLLTAGKVEQNLGNLHHRRNHYSQAEQSYDSARRLFAAIGDQRLLVFAENGLANVLTLRHQLREAAQLYEQALARASAIGAEVTRAEIECNLGNLALLQGSYDQALRFLEQSRRHYAALDMPHESVLAELELADAYLELNLVDEAANVYERSIKTLVELGMRAEQARAQANYARACIALERLSDAKTLIKEARDSYAAEGNTVGEALVVLTIAQIARMEGDQRQAVTLAEAAEHTLNALNVWGQMLMARWLRADALRELGQFDQARVLLEDTVQAARERMLPQIERTCRTSLGLIARAEGDQRQAEHLFRQAVELTEAMRAPLPVEEFHAAFLADKLEAYTELVRVLLDDQSADRGAEALEYIERLRARSISDAVSSALSEPEDAAEAALIGQLTTTREALNAVYTQLNRLQDAGVPLQEDEIAQLQQMAHNHERRIQQISRQRQQIGRRATTTSHVFERAATQAALGADQAMVVYFTIKEELVAFVVTRDHLHVVRQLASCEQINTAMQQVRFQVSALRFGSGLGSTFNTSLTRRIKAHLQTLYDLLLRPLEPYIGDKHLVIVPHAALYYVPFHALHDGTMYVVEQREVSSQLSARLVHKPPRSSPLEHAVLVGVPDDRTPSVRREITVLAELFAHSDTLLDGDATLAALAEHASHADVLHLACHGAFRPDNPLFSSLRLADGQLTVRDAYNLKLQCKLAVLSACETGVSMIAPGDEVLGMSRGFFAAGAEALLVSLWAVDDDATAHLMESLYRNLLAGQKASTALRNAQIHMLKHYDHPFFWAPFRLICQ